jgi:prepilin-type N-terminal cleavage/methylation domain-containing protein/prepilin-type processing-associated H-X9-DG protein
MTSGHITRRHTALRKGQRQAFTLIELLVVMAILVLLMALLLPVAHRARKHVATVACQGNLRQWGLLLDTYVTGNDGKFFSALTYVDTQAEPEPATVWVQSWWYIFLTDFGNYRDIWLCPLATTPSTDGKTGSTFRAWRGERGAERLAGGRWGEVDREFRGSYGVNGWVGLSPYPESDRPNAACWTTPYVKGATNVPLVFDCARSLYYGTLDDPPPQEEADPSVSYSRGVCMDRHAGGINVVFMDWSMRKVRLKQLWGLKWHQNYNTAGPWTAAGGVKPGDWPAWMRRFKEDG